MVIQVNDFAKVVNDEGLVEYGINVGDHIYVSGSGFVPVSKADPYKYRLIFVAARLDAGGHIQTDGGFTIDGKSLKKATKPVTTKLLAIRDKDFAPDEEQLAIAAQAAEAE